MSFYQALKVCEERIRNLQKQKKRIYRKGYIFDENKSVIWNITTLNEENEKILQNNKNIQLQINYWEEELEKEIAKEISLNYPQLPYLCRELILQKCLEDYLGDGYQAVYENAMDLAEFIYMLKCQKVL